MIEPLVLVLALATSGSAEAGAASPSPSPSPTASVQLKEIGHVTTSAMCTGIVMRANSAISSALRNDQTVVLSIGTLRQVDLDSTNPIDKQRGINEIDRLAADLRNSAKLADAQIKKLREMSRDATDPVRKAELKEFADSLGGAISRQDRIGSDLQKMLTIMDGRDARAQAHADMRLTSPETLNLWVPSDRQRTFDTHYYNTLARGAAKDLEDRTLGIAAEESKAANHIVGAVNGC